MQAILNPTPAQPIVRGPVVTLRFQGGAPPPHPPVVEPTPDEEYQNYEANRAAQQQQRDMARDAQLTQQQQQGGGGAFFKISKFATSVAAVMEKTAGDIHAKGEAQVRQLAREKNQERFVAGFPELVQAGDQLICDFSCKVLSQGHKVSGNLQVTTRHICFISETVRDIIPLQEIASIQRSVALETVDNGPPFIMPIPAPHVIADTLQLFTVRMQVFQFVEFESTFSKAGTVLTSTIKGRAVDRLYNFLDHAWRSATAVPLPGFSYAAY